MSSKTVAIYPIVEALVRAEDLMGKVEQWHSTNRDQLRFRHDYLNVCREEREIPEIESLASMSAFEINEFLKAHGIDLDITLADKEFGIAAVLDLLIEWVIEGERFPIWRTYDKEYEGVRLSEGVRYYKSLAHPHPIATITTKSGDLVYMTKLARPPELFDLVDLAMNLTRHAHSAQYGKLIFPMVDLDQKVDIDWLIGMSADSPKLGRVTISQAKQQTILKMNELGVRAKSGFTGAVRSVGYEPPKPDMIIDEPFLLWATRDRHSVPFFVGHIDTEDWKNPGKLTD